MTDTSGFIYYNTPYHIMVSFNNGSSYQYLGAVSASSTPACSITTGGTYIGQVSSITNMTYWMFVNPQDSNCEIVNIQYGQPLSIVNNIGSISSTSIQNNPYQMMSCNSAAGAYIIVPTNPNIPIMVSNNIMWQLQKGVGNTGNVLITDTFSVVNSTGMLIGQNGAYITLSGTSVLFQIKPLTYVEMQTQGIMTTASIISLGISNNGYLGYSYNTSTYDITSGASPFKQLQVTNASNRLLISPEMGSSTRGSVTQDMVVKVGDYVCFLAVR